MTARIHFAANDDRGNFTGRASAIEIELANGEQITLAIETRVARFKDSIRIGGREGIRMRRQGWWEWVGNMAWDATTISVEDAKATARWLLSHGAVAESFTAGTFEGIVREDEVRRG